MVGSTVGGLRPWSVKAACETLHRSKRQPEDSPCPLSVTPGSPVMHWVSPWRTTAVDEDAGSDPDSEGVLDSLSGEWDSQPKPLRADSTEDDGWRPGSDPEVDMYLGEEESVEKWLKTDGDYEGDWEEGDDEVWDSSASTEHVGALRGLFPLLQKGQETNDSSWGSEPELEYLRDGESLYAECDLDRITSTSTMTVPSQTPRLLTDVPAGTTLQTPSPEPRDDPPSCFSCSDASDKV